ncbi:MAG: hypothetical protein COS84_04815 [Armatimonadetes bacterium CG07_land_8_20_14_0_80_40_9]|nr:MAG: hypothetical protein COS84_04815 [Armatimonadetes bacterium CG07_land_8_20_14_0_80_40_9]
MSFSIFPTFSSPSLEFLIFAQTIIIAQKDKFVKGFWQNFLESQKKFIKKQRKGTNYLLEIMLYQIAKLIFLTGFMTPRDL